MINHSTKHRISLSFKPAGWFGYDLNRFDGFILNEKKEKLRFLYGKWNDYLKSAPVEDYEAFLKANNQKFRAPDKPGNDFAVTPRKVMSKLNSFTRQLTGSGHSIDQTTTTEDVPPTDLPSEAPSGDIPKSDSSHSLDISNSRILWKVSPRPEHSAAYYHFNYFALTLNELPQEDVLDTFPLTDSRFRPDIRKLEEGDLGKCHPLPLPFSRPTRR